MSVSDVASDLFESWIINLAAVQGGNRKRIVGGFASVIGDKTYEWMTQADLQHLPAYASAAAISLIASERQLDVQSNEATASIADRAPFWLTLAHYYGSGLGILLGLHFAGYDGATLIQQNGRALTLTLPLPPFVLGQAWDPSPNLVVTACPPLALPLTSTVTPGRSIPAGTPWYAIDGDTDFTSRFVVVFPTALPTAAATIGVALFRGTSEVATATWRNAFADTSYNVQVGIPLLSDNGGPVHVYADPSTKSATGVQIVASSATFTGSVPVLAWRADADPYASLFGDLERIRATILKWKPAKATCSSVSTILAGRLWGFPLTVAWGDGGMWGGTASRVLRSF